MLLILSASIVTKVLVEKIIPKEFLTHVIDASIKHHRFPVQRNISNQFMMDSATLVINVITKQQVSQV